MAFQYNAFISYRRAEGSGYAANIRRHLLAFRVPKAVRDLMRVVENAESPSLSPSEALHEASRLSVYLDTIYAQATEDFFQRVVVPALEASQYLIVVATRSVLEAARAEGTQSDWVLKEIAHFRTLPQGRNIIVAVEHEQLGRSLPAVLTGGYPNSERLDLQAFEKTVRIPGISSRAREEIVKLAAPLFQIPMQLMPQLREEDALAIRRQRRWAWTATLGVAVTIATLGYLALQASVRSSAARQVAASRSFRQALDAVQQQASSSALAHLAQALRGAPSVAARTMTADLILRRTWRRLTVRFDSGDEVIGDSGFSRDGTVAFVAAGRRIKLWNPVTGRELGSLDGIPAGAGVHINAAGDRLITLGDDTLTLWDIATRASIGSLTLFREARGDQVFNVDGIETTRLPSTKSAHFSASGRLIVVSGGDGVVRVADATKLEPLQQDLTFRGFVESAELSNDDKLLAVSDGTRLSVTQVGDHKELISIACEARAPRVTFSADSRFIAAGCAQHSVTIVNLETRQTVVHEFGDFAFEIVWSPSTRNHLAVSLGSEIYVFSGAEETAVVLKGAGVRLFDQLEFAEDDNELFAIDGQWVAVRWNIRTGEQINEAHIAPWDGSSLPPSLNYERSPIMDSPAGSVRQIWSPRISYGDPVTIPHGGEVIALDINHDDRFVVTGSSDGLAQVWDARTGNPSGLAMRHEHVVDRVLFSPDGKWIATTARDERARIWHSDTGLPASDWLPHDHGVAGIGFSADSKRLITASPSLPGGLPDGQVHFWSVPDGREVQRREHRLRMGDDISLKVVPIGQMSVVVSSGGDTLRLWSDEGEPLCSPIDVGRRPQAFGSRTAPSLLLIVGSQNSEVWDVARCRKIRAAKSPRDEIQVGSFISDSTALVVGYSKVSMWNLDSGSVSSADDSPEPVAIDLDRSGRIALGVTSGEVTLRNLETWPAAMARLRNPDYPTAMRFSHDGQKLLTAVARVATIWGVPLVDAKDAEAMADLAEMVCQCSIGERETVVQVQRNETTVSRLLNASNQSQVLRALSARVLGDQMHPPMPVRQTSP